MNYDIQPIGNRVLIRLDEPEAQIGSIVIPEVAQEKPLQGTVIAQGTQGPFALELGARVLLTKYSGQPLTGADESGLLIVAREDEILCALRPSVAIQPAARADAPNGRAVRAPVRG